jgi:hypothetical protein
MLVRFDAGKGEKTKHEILGVNGRLLRYLRGTGRTSVMIRGPNYG